MDLNGTAAIANRIAMTITQTISMKQAASIRWKEAA
jgi:hypothetical protein